MATEFDSPASGHPAAECADTSSQPQSNPSPIPSRQILPPGTFELISELQQRLARGETFTNPKLTALADAHFGGSRMQGRYTPKDAYDAVEAAVNRHLLETDARALMEMADPALGLKHILEPLLKQLPRQEDRTHEQQLLQQFSTPPTLAFVAARALNPRPTDRVVEPSAGTGSLAIWVAATGAELITNEISPRRRALLELLGFNTLMIDAEYLDDLLPDEIRPTAALMNPPFSATGGRVAANNTFYGARHIETMLKRLALGGRLVAVAGQGMGLEKPAFTNWWKAIAARYTVRANLSLSGENYAKYGTSFDNQLIVIDKTGPTPGGNWEEQLRAIRYGEVPTLTEAISILAPIAADRPRPGEIRTSQSSVAICNPSAAIADSPATVPDEVPTGQPQTSLGVAREPEPEQTTEPTIAQTSAATEVITCQEQAPAAAAIEDAPEETDEEAAVFVPYNPALLKGGSAHPAEIVEAASMGAIYPPPITYRPHLPKRIIDEGLLSTIQLERVIYAGQAHEQRQPDGARTGFFVGDGTGLGKGRILAGIIADNWFQGRRRALWLSVNNDLMDSALRDLTDLGLRVPLARINDYPATGEITLAQGVIFSSYSSLISAAKTGEKRLDQIQRWLGTDGVVILDESHKAKNALAGGRGEPTQTGQAVIDLQDPLRNPDYRIVYSSATGATDVRNMAYLTRLLLWGPGTSFPGGFSEFMTQIDAGGVGAMEMVARDLKALGRYASGSISFGRDRESGKAVEYREVIHRLTPEQRRMYDHMARAWSVILQNIHEALKITNGDSRSKANAMTKFWGDHQRCCRQVISAFKVPTIIKEVERALAEGHQVVISLIGTGESKTKEQISKQTAAGGMIEDLDFGPRESICGMVDRGFPVNLYQEKTDPVTQQTIRVPVLDKAGNPVQSKEALEMKQRLMDSLSTIELPEHPLDQIINYFGDQMVAELTGRKRRLVRRNGRLEYVKRAPEGVAMEKTNLYEMALFQKGKKRIAIISDAASTGISLHADRRTGNHHRREHMTLELNWSADRQMQTFGRTHRSNQAVPPIYTLVSTELGGEKRFSSTIARRLGSLGALTKGDRGAADGGSDLAKYNFETPQGTAALRLLFSRILENKKVPGLDNPRQTLRDMGLLILRADGTEEVKKEDLHNIPRFLNRVLALDVERQNAIFDYFADLFDQTVRYAKANGSFDEGVSDVKATSIRLARPPKVVHQDRTTSAQTTHFTLEVDQPTRPVSFSEAGWARQSAFYEQVRSGHFILATESGSHTDPESGASYRTFAVTKPEGARVSYLKESELKRKYRPVRAEAARAWWESRYEAVPKTVTVEMHIIGGAIIPLWQHLKTGEDSILRVVRVTTDDGLRIVGVQIPQTQVAHVLRAIGVKRSFKEPEKIFSGVLEEGEEINLIGGLKLRQSSVHREPAIELLAGADESRFNEFRELGLINERIQYKQRFFIPTDATAGREILKALLDRYPAVDAATPENENAETVEQLEESLVSQALHTTFEGSGEIVDVNVLVIKPEPDESYAPPTMLPDLSQPSMGVVDAAPLLTLKEAREEEQPEAVLPAQECTPSTKNVESARPTTAPSQFSALSEHARAPQRRKSKKVVDENQLGFLWDNCEGGVAAGTSS